VKQAPVVLGIDVGGTAIAAGAVDATGRVLRATVEPARDPAAIVEQIIACARSFEDLIPIAIGLGVPGAVEAKTGRVIGEVFNLPALTDFPLGAHLRKKLRRSVVVDNDVNALALGELRWGAVKGRRDFVLIAVGTGVGGAIVLDGKLRRGAHGFAGELGHATVNFRGRDCFCGAVGCLKAYAAGPDLAAQFGNPMLTSEQVVAAARAGNRRARVVLDTAAHALGAACANLVHTLDPELIVLGGSVARGLPLATIRSYAKQHTLSGVRGRTPIVLSKLNKRRAFLGAAALAWDHCKPNPNRRSEP